MLRIKIARVLSPPVRTSGINIEETSILLIIQLRWITGPRGLRSAHLWGADL